MSLSSPDKQQRYVSVLINNPAAATTFTGPENHVCRDSAAITVRNNTSNTLLLKILLIVMFVT